MYKQLSCTVSPLTENKENWHQIIERMHVQKPFKKSYAKCLVCSTVELFTFYILLFFKWWLSSLALMYAFAWIMAQDNVTFWHCMFKNHLKTATSNTSWPPPRSFWRFTFCRSSSDDKSLSSFLAHLDKVFFGTRYFATTSLFGNPFSVSLRAWQFSLIVLWRWLCFGATNKLVLFKNTNAN